MAANIGPERWIGIKKSLVNSIVYKNKVRPKHYTTIGDFFKRNTYKLLRFQNCLFTKLTQYFTYIMQNSP